MVLVISVAGVLLGGLWLLQGVGAERLRPIFCFADCAPLQGPSATWAITGFLVLAAGGFGIFFSRRRR